jgi:hypothetical protein
MFIGANLVVMVSGFNADDTWGHRAGEPNKAVICSLALARLRTDPSHGSGDTKDNSMVGMAQKLLLFWRKPAVCINLSADHYMLIT